MKTILCYGDSNTWGNIAGSRNKELMLAKRFSKDIRWTGVLQELLGSEFYIVEAGLNGRNTSFDEAKFTRPSRNGLATLPLILEMNYPLDLVILMLGTNDAIIDFKASAEQTTIAIQKMIHLIKTSHFGPGFKAPKVLIIAPAPIHRIDSPDFNLFFEDSSIFKTKELTKHYENLAKVKNCDFIDAGRIVKVSDDDGVHIEANSHQDLAREIANKVKYIFSNRF